MKLKIFTKEIIVTVLLITVAVLSIFVVAKPAQSADTYKSTISSLDNKKMIAIGVTTAAVGTSAALAAIPGDATTPIANKVADIGSYMMLVVGAVFLEKMLVTLFGYLSFTYVIPAACIIAVLSMFINKAFLKTLAVKLFILGMAAVLIIPFSVKISDIIYENHRETVEQSIENTNAKIEETNGNENGGIMGFINSVGESLTSAADRAEKVLSRFVDAVAILIITTCIIPIAVVLFAIWFVKFLFGTNVRRKYSYKTQEND